MLPRLGLVIVLLAVYATSVGPVVAEPSTNTAFQSTWSRTDQPVASGEVNRTWMWGPEAFTGALSEPYLQSPGGQRTVQYFDKSRMEITDPSFDQSSIWYVTNGLLVQELITGQMQTGVNQFEARSPAAVNVAGDADDTSGPTYAAMANVRHAPPLTEGNSVMQRIHRDGSTSTDRALASRGVVAAYFDAETNHTVASPFWDFMNATGLVMQGGSFVYAPLFENPFFATGRPITEAYWATVKVGGVQQDVLLQCFERRCLTYTPGNDEGWQVEAGNVGQHYYQWRYGSSPPQTTPPPASTQPPPADPDPPVQGSLPEPIFTDAWLDPVPSVIHAFGNPNDPWVAGFVEHAFEIAGLYNVSTAELGFWNHDTRGFMPWLETYAASWYTTDGGTYRQELFEHAYTQMLYGIHDPQSNISQWLRFFEVLFESEYPGAGPEAYWYYLVGPAWEAGRMAMTPLAREGHYNQFWNRLVPDYQLARINDPSIQSFADYLASRRYGLDGRFSVQ